MTFSDCNIYVDPRACIACGDCVERCLLDNLRLSLSPCRSACPLEMNCQGYIRLIAQGREEEAAQVMSQGSAFAEILGRVCHHPCELACQRRQEDGEAVNVRALKRYLAERHPHIANRPLEAGPEKGKAAAIVGSGPAGLEAAWALRAQGYGVTVYESDPEPGGLLRYGIPAFRLPAQVVDEAVDRLAAAGVDFRTGAAVGREVDLEQLRREHDAVILALGSGQAAELDIPGREQKGVIQALDLLRDSRMGRTLPLGARALVIGGGNTAVDAAMICRLSGAEDVTIACLEAQPEMPAFAREVSEALEIGVKLEPGWGPVQVSPCDKGGLKMEMACCRSVYDAGGAFRPQFDDRLRLDLEAETVVLAIGQQPLNEGWLAGLQDEASGRLAASGLTLQSPRAEDLFVCGDVHSGPSSAVEAMASGRRAAVSAGRYMAGEGLRWGRDPLGDISVQEFQPNPEVGSPDTRLEPGRLPPKERSLVKEVESAFTEDQAVQEARRCLSCGRAFEANQACWFCLPCEIDCPTQALEVRMPYLLR
ncbi:MAG: FAD-dependent oxidoreductase [Desulfarculaceae bacterium]|jgi:NADPH-dependent glutamate synthase beta subunit-like oxidoreductase